MKDAWNYNDILYCGLGWLNIQQQWSGYTWSLSSKIVSIVVLLLCLVKTMFFFRIFLDFSYIVTMMIQVCIDLKVFNIFFLLLIIMFSLIFDIIDVDAAQQDEYKATGQFIGNFLQTFRLSLGDFDFSFLSEENSPHMDTKMHLLFWGIWMIMVLMTSLIFLNFIIAEVSNSYQNVKDELEALIYKERALMILEIENITRDHVIHENKQLFPKYFVIRKLED